MKVEILSKETIKPSSPTPANRRNFKLSLFDQYAAPMYGSLVYFYAAKHHVSPSQTSQNLKKSLSDTLTLYYQLAGKTVDNMMIDCNDNGALYVEARVDIPMSGFLQQPDGHDLQLFLPTKIEYNEATTGFFSLVQVSFFKCGGVAIGTCISHKLVDGVSMRTFMRSWAGNMTGGFSDKLTFYEAAELFPATEIFSNREVLPLEPEAPRLPFIRLVFDMSKLARLKARFGDRENTPSRSELVTAIIWKSALNAARSNSRSSKYSAMYQPVNIRSRISSPVMMNSVGNVLGPMTAITDQSQVDLRCLVRELRKGLDVFLDKFVKLLQSDKSMEAASRYLIDSVREIARDDVEPYACSSLCNMSLYDVDFGCGRPVWVTNPVVNKKNIIGLIDGNKGDGSVEAWVVLSEEDMSLFQRDPELLNYASINPSVQDQEPFWIKSCM